MAAREAESARDHRRVQAILRAGLALSVAAMLAGIAVALATGACDLRAMRPADVLGPTPAGLRLVTLGVVLLALTPAARVVALVVLWARARDRRFVAVALAVAAVLVVSVIVGRG